MKYKRKERVWGERENKQPPEGQNFEKEEDQVMFTPKKGKALKGSDDGGRKRERERERETKEREKTREQDRETLERGMGWEEGGRRRGERWGGGCCGPA